MASGVLVGRAMIRKLPAWVLGLVILTAPVAARPALAQASTAISHRHHAHAHHRHHAHGYAWVASRALPPAHPASLPRPTRATPAHRIHPSLERSGKGGFRAFALPDRFLWAPDPSSMTSAPAGSDFVRSKPRDVMASRAPPRAGPTRGNLARRFPPAFLLSLHPHESIRQSSAAVLVARAPLPFGARGAAVSDFPSSARAGLRVRRRGGAAPRACSASEGAVS